MYRAIDRHLRWRIRQISQALIASEVRPSLVALEARVLELEANLGLRKQASMPEDEY